LHIYTPIRRHRSILRLTVRRRTNDLWGAAGCRKFLARFVASAFACRRSGGRGAVVLALGNLGTTPSTLLMGRELSDPR